MRLKECVSCGYLQKQLGQVHVKWALPSLREFHWNKSSFQQSVIEKAKGMFSHKSSLLWQLFLFRPNDVFHSDRIWMLQSIFLNSPLHLILDRLNSPYPNLFSFFAGVLDPFLLQAQYVISNHKKKNHH